MRCRVSYYDINAEFVLLSNASRLYGEGGEGVGGRWGWQRMMSANRGTLVSLGERLVKLQFHKILCLIKITLTIFLGPTS